jgi:hypothetical protein
MNKYWVRIIINFVLLLLIVGAALLMQGCSTGINDEDTSCLTTYSYDYDVVGETGLTLKATTPQYTYISFEEMEAEYRDIEACAANTNTPGPTVIFTSFLHLGTTGTAFYVYNSMTAYINTDPHATSGAANLQRNCISDRELFRHEALHHILYLNGEDSGHTNSKFSSCNALGPKTCNGEYCE